jgi:hypothetical protein
MKTCSKCKQEKASTEFYKNKTKIDGLSSYCKLCRKEVDSHSRKNRPEYIKNWVKNNIEKHKEYVAKVHTSINPGIYKVTCLVTGNFYIGQSITPYRRKAQHFTIHSDKGSTNPFLQADLKQYGKEKFTFEIIEHCKPEQLLERESYWIKQLNPAYNVNLVTEIL